MILLQKASIIELNKTKRKYHLLYSENQIQRNTYEIIQNSKELEQTKHAS